MKKAVLISTLVLAFVPFVHAEKPMNLPECKAIAEACEAHGFHPNDHKKNGHGLWIDCVKKIAKGEKVDGVTNTADEAKACEAAAHANRKHRK